MAEREASEEGEWKSESFAFAFNPCSIDREDCVIRIYIYVCFLFEKYRKKGGKNFQGSEDRCAFRFTIIFIAYFSTCRVGSSFAGREASDNKAITMI